MTAPGQAALRRPEEAPGKPHLLNSLGGPNGSGGALSHRRGFVNSSSDSRFAAFRGAGVMITGGLGLFGSAPSRRLIVLGAEGLPVDSVVAEARGDLAH